MMTFSGEIAPNAAALIAGLGSGDILAMAGRSRVSRTIKVGTCSRFSHVAGISRVSHQLLTRLARQGAFDHLQLQPFPDGTPLVAGWTDRHVLIEATTLCTDPCLFLGTPVRGVQAHVPAERIAKYDGQVWVCKVNP
ncbi:MAG: hypothetical protein JNG90_06690, partial [Planctomycetaceae bacterium]|nr:hypothetical protein [Planctomycetaceae bacterium]